MHSAPCHCPCPLSAPALTPSPSPFSWSRRRSAAFDETLMVQSANRPTSKRSQFSKLNAIFICNLCKLSWSALQLATCSLQRAACCSLGTLKSSLSHHQLSSTALAAQSWLLSGTQRHLTTNICDIKCCNRGTVCLAVASSAVVSSCGSTCSFH